MLDAESIDWQMPAVRQTKRATGSSWNSDQRRLTFGMLATNTWLFGTPVVRTFIAARNRMRKSDTDVIVERIEVQTSFAPMRIVT